MWPNVRGCAGSNNRLVGKRSSRCSYQCCVQRCQNSWGCVCGIGLCDTHFNWPTKCYEGKLLSFSWCHGNFYPILFFPYIHRVIVICHLCPRMGWLWSLTTWLNWLLRSFQDYWIQFVASWCGSSKNWWGQMSLGLIHWSGILWDRLQVVMLLQRTFGLQSLSWTCWLIKG